MVKLITAKKEEVTREDSQTGAAQRGLHVSSILLNHFRELGKLKLLSQKKTKKCGDEERSSDYYSTPHSILAGKIDKEA